MKWAAALAACWMAAAACATIGPRPVYPPEPASGGGQGTLVVGVARDAANQAPVDALARELAFGLAERGRAALDLSALGERARVGGRPLPPGAEARLRAGLADPEALAWLGAAGISAIVFIEPRLYDQEWAHMGKRTRIGIEARERQLGGGEQSWYVRTAPAERDDPGRGFQTGTRAALAALLRAMTGEPRAGPDEAEIHPPRP